MKHLEDQGETYFEHFGYAIKFAGVFFVLSLVCAVHALIPCLFTSTASSRLESLLNEMRRCNAEKQP